MFLNVIALLKAFLEDQLVDDTTFIYELVEVRILSSKSKTLRLLPYTIRRPEAVWQRAQTRVVVAHGVSIAMWSLLSKTGVDEQGKQGKKTSPLSQK